jgi:hypothetical protein
LISAVKQEEKNDCADEKQKISPEQRILRPKKN